MVATPDAKPSVPPWRVVIAGGGIAGLSLALALKRALNSAVDVALCDPALARDPALDRRAYAIAAGPRRMLDALGVWTEIDARAQPIVEMVITDSRLQDPVRPAFLSFAGEVEPGEPFAHMVEGAVLTTALLGRCGDAGVAVRHTSVQRIEAGRGTVGVDLDEGEHLRAALVVAANGARSRLREEAGLGWVHWSYPQHAVV